MEKEQILASLEAVPGKTGFYFKNLVTGETLSHHPELPLQTASVIKLAVLVEAFAQAEEGTLDFEETYTLRPEDKLPSCGALTYLHDGLQVTMRDLCTLMIILSDNTATNLLLKKLTMEAVNRRMEGLGLKATRVNRLLFDSQAAAHGLENTSSAQDMGELLERMYLGRLVSPAASAEMLEILKKQRLNGKIPFWFGGRYRIAHKTGEDDGITNDVGIVFGPQPYVVCFFGNDTDTPRFERLIQDAAFALDPAREEISNWEPEP